MKSKAKNPIQKYKNWIGMGLVLVVFVVVLLIAGKPSQPKSKLTKSKTTSERTRRERTARPKKKRDREEKLAEKARRKLERARRREERSRGASGSRARASRSERPARESRTGSRIRTEASYVLKGIFTDEKGEKYALIGERRARSGDLVAGRRIQEVQSDRISVEYGGSSYEVRVGNSLF